MYYSITGNTYNVHSTIADDNGDQIPNPKYVTKKISKNETEVVIPLKHLSSFWKSLNIQLINCEIELILTWSINCVPADMTARDAGNNNDPQQLLYQMD